MPKRIQIAALPEDHDELLFYWAWMKRRSRAALVTHTMEARIEANEELILRGLQRAADRRGITVEEMKQRILQNPRYDWDGDKEEAIETEEV